MAVRVISFPYTLWKQLFSRCENKLRESWLLQKLVQQGAFGWLLGFWEQKLQSKAKPNIP
jgi:hypothetical protein